MCKTESFRAGKEHCIIQTALHAAMLSSKTAVLVCAVRFSCPPVEGGGACPPFPHGGAAHEYDDDDGGGGGGFLNAVQKAMI